MTARAVWVMRDVGLYEKDRVMMSVMMSHGVGLMFVSFKLNSIGSEVSVLERYGKRE